MKPRLTEEQVNARVEQLTTDGSYSITIAQESNVHRIFENLMKEERNKNMIIDEQIMLVDNIVHDFSTNQTEKFIMRYHGDSSNMSYFDNKLEEGASYQIEDALNKHGIPLSVLRGIQKNQPFYKNIDGVEVIQEIENNGVDTPKVTEFTIKKDGETIYDFNKSFFTYKNLETNETEEFDSKEDYIRYKIESGESVRVNVNTPEFSYQKNYYISSADNLIENRQYAAGTIINGKNVGGQFMKKE